MSDTKRFLLAGTVELTVDNEYSRALLCLSPEEAMEIGSALIEAAWSAK